MYACHTIALEQLLSIRDGEPVDAHVMVHVAKCAACTREVVRLRNVQVALGELPTMTAPAFLDVQSVSESRRSVVRRPQHLSRMTLRAGIAASIALLVGIIGFARFESGSTISSNREQIATGASRSAQSNELADSHAASARDQLPLLLLVSQSQELDAQLQRLPQRPHVERGSTTLTIDSLQSRIQWVDYQLTLAKDVGLSERQSAELWQDRVRLMDSLVKVRFAESQQLAYLH